MPELVLVESAGQQYAVLRSDVRQIVRSSSINLPSLAQLLGSPAAPEGYILVSGPEAASFALSVARADLVTLDEPLALPTVLQTLAHPAVLGLVIYSNHLVPLLDLARLIAMLPTKESNS